MSKRILITGIAGFIGFHLALALKRRGDHVVGCDNYEPYYSPQLKRERSALLHRENIPVIDLDLAIPQALMPILCEQKIGHVVHLAAQAGVRHSIECPEKYLKANGEGFLNLLEQLRHFPDILCTYASSSSVYGANKKIPFSEGDPISSPTNVYAATKIFNEALAHTYHHLYGLSVTGLRFFTVYGPWGRPDMAYFTFTKAIQEGKPIRIHNRGEMRRDFTYIDDTVQGILAAVDLQQRGACEIFNLGNSRSESIETLIALIEKFLGKPAQREYLPMQPGEVVETYADLEKSRRCLLFAPKISLQEGMEYFLKWYLDRREPSLIASNEKALV